ATFTVNVNNILTVGANDLRQGLLYLYGNNATDGGAARFYNGDGEDGTYQYYQIGAEGANLWLGPDTNTDAFIFSATGNLTIDGSITAAAFAQNTFGQVALTGTSGGDSSYAMLSHSARTSLTSGAFRQMGSGETVVNSHTTQP